MSNLVLGKPADGLQTVIELTLLMNLVNPGTLRDCQLAPEVNQFSHTSVLWRQFIDALAWLADSHKGGETVAAICGVLIDGQPRLLLASNGGVKQEVSEHIHSILSILQGSEKVVPGDRAAVLEDIIQSSVYTSRNKIKNYSSQLSRLVQKVEDDPERSNIDIDSPLYRTLVVGRSLRNEYLALCQWAYQYSRHSDIRYLNEKCSAEPKLPIYHRIRHYVGRLGSWHRAASSLVLAAVKMPNLIHNLRIEIVPSQPTVWPTTTEVGSLPGLIEKIDIGLNTDHVLQNLQAFYDETIKGNPDACKDVQQAFTALLTDESFRPTVHAEVLLADYVFAGQLVFINSDNYISASKPACVLCRLYLEAHPLKVSTPHCHGNLWPQWSPPLLTSENTIKHVDSLAKHMITRLQKLLWNRLMYGHRDLLRLPDSTTGITPSTTNGIVGAGGKGSGFE